MLNHSKNPARILYRTVKPLVLASASPRRRCLLERLGIRFQVIPSGLQEPPISGSPEEGVGKLARMKALDISDRFGRRWVLAADTIVVLGGRIFGKPDAETEALSMLRQLNGRTHEVLTSVCLAHRASGVLMTRTVRTRVTFREVREDELAAYVRTGEPMDKAGAYGIQDLGGFLVRSVHGSYTNVVGLPLAETLEMLLKNEIIVPGHGPIEETSEP